MIEAEWWDYDSLDELADAVASDVGFIIDSALDARGQAMIALPGGKTPIPIFDRLQAQPRNWKRVTILPTDDRLVAPTDPLSNVGLIARTFLPKGARVIPLIGDAKADYKKAGHDADVRLGDLKWPLDLVWLGVGANGHTASIFDGPDLAAAIDAPATCHAIGVMPGTLPDEAPVARVTLTRATLMAARTLTIVVTGKDKRKVLEKAIKDGAKSTVPVGLVLAGTELPIDIHWAA
ncbi:MAG: 6-phosphogluconolactonase [Janthinobacterium lividum]